jgi:hypothetical protein
MFRISYGPSSGSHKLLLTEVTGFVSVLAYFCARRQCLAAYPDCKNNNVIYIYIYILYNWG